MFRNEAKSEVKLEPTLPLLAEPAREQVETSQEELFLPFTSPACRSSALVGGKGCQLALLTQMSEMVIFTSWFNIEQDVGFLEIFVLGSFLSVCFEEQLN